MTNDVGHLLVCLLYVSSGEPCSDPFVFPFLVPLLSTPELDGKAPVADRFTVGAEFDSDKWPCLLTWPASPEGTLPSGKLVLGSDPSWSPPLIAPGEKQLWLLSVQVSERRTLRPAPVVHREGS